MLILTIVFWLPTLRYSYRTSVYAGVCTGRYISEVGKAQLEAQSATSATSAIA